MEVTITKAEAVLTDRDTLTGGMVGKTVTLNFSGEWDGLLRTAVFRAGNEIRDVVLESAALTEDVVIPHEVLAQPERKLYLGVYGTDAAGTVALPTIWCELGPIRPGADPAGDESAEPTPDVWAQMRGLIEELDRSKAPVGYGYGEAAEYLGSFASEEELGAGLDTVFAGMKNQETKLVSATFAWYTTYYIWLVEIYRDAEKYGIMRAVSEVYNGSFVYATRGASGWNPLMWDDPPMYTGVEYLTKEDYNGKRVYTKLVNFGAMPSNGFGSVAHGAEAAKVVRCQGTMSNGRTLPFYTGSYRVDIYADASKVYIVTNYDYSGYTAQIQIWYTKDS